MNVHNATQRPSPLNRRGKVRTLEAVVKPGGFATNDECRPPCDVIREAWTVQACALSYGWAKFDPGVAELFAELLNDPTRVCEGGASCE